MKTLKTKLIILASILMLSNANIKAQITLEHTFLDSCYMGDLFYCTDIGNNDFKYVFLNKYKNSFSLYNMDMSPYLTNVQIPVIADSISDGFGVIYITKALFDCDTTNIEYAFEVQWDMLHPFRVFRTDGTLLLQVDSANGPYGFGLYDGSHDVRPIVNTSAGTKLFLQKYHPNNYPEVRVYALCGTLPTNVYDFSEHNKSFVKVFPNPATEELNFEVTPPNNLEEFQIVIFDAAAKEQKRESISLQRGKCSLDVRNYSSGIYLYSLIGKNKVYQSGKFVLNK